MSELMIGAHVKMRGSTEHVVGVVRAHEPEANEEYPWVVEWCGKQLTYEIRESAKDLVVL